MRAMLRAQAEAAERRGSYSRAVHEAFTRAGFYRTLQPRRFGGYEFGLDTFFRVIVELARGDPGTAWGMCLAAGHAFHVASFFSERAQAEIFGDGHFCAPHRAAATGHARPAGNGYVVSGTWDYCSGITHATHFLATAMAPNPDGSARPVPMVCVIPRGRYTVIDDWGGGATLGLNASGSNSVTVEDVFVPSHLAEPYTWKDFVLRPEGTAGYALHGNPLYVGRTVAFYIAELVAPQVGAALAALDEYETMMRTKLTSFPPRVPRTESVDFQRWYGEAMARAQAAHVLVIGTMERWMRKAHAWAAGSDDFTVDDDAQLRGVLLQAAELAWRAVDLMFATGGSSAARRGSRLQRYYRDVSMYRTHIGAQYEVTATSAGRVHLGLPLTF